MKWLFPGLLVLFIAAGCNPSSPKIIPENRMIKVMWDMIQVDEFTTGFLAKDSSKNLKLERMKLYKQVFALHHVSDKEYFASFKYYTARPDLFKRVVDSLSERATREQRTIHIPAPVPAVAK